MKFLSNRLSCGSAMASVLAGVFPSCFLLFSPSFYCFPFFSPYFSDFLLFCRPCISSIPEKFKASSKDLSSFSKASSSFSSSVGTYINRIFLFSLCLMTFLLLLLLGGVSNGALAGRVVVGVALDWDSWDIGMVLLTEVLLVSTRSLSSCNLSPLWL